MTTDLPDKPDRRTALTRVFGVGAASVALPLVSRLIPEAQAASAHVGAQKNQGDVIFIPGRDAVTTTLAEWQDPKVATGPFRIAASKQALERAPKEACRYEAKTYNYPSGSIRVLTFKKGGPLHHMISFETEILVLAGSATLTPLPGLAGKPVTVKAGDALFLPSGNFTAPKLSEDLVLLTFLVSNTKKDAKASIIKGSDLKATVSMEWEEGGKEVNARTPEEMKKAPKGAHQLTLKRYVFDGNSIRHATLKGGKSGNFKNTRVDVLIYIAKGKVRRIEGDQTLELVAGDTIREKLGNPGWWEPHEETIFIATDAPVNPGLAPPSNT